MPVCLRYYSGQPSRSYKNLTSVSFSCPIFVIVKVYFMKLNKSVWFAFALLIIVGSVCRVMGFAPQIAMAVFGAAVIKDKRLAFVLPLVSMFLSDVLYEVLFHMGYTNYGGFYSGQTFFDGQIMNYLILAAMTLVGFWARSLSLNRII